MIRLFLFFALAFSLRASQPFYDRPYPSKVFNQPRHYRIFLPSDYETSGRQYPVIYYFHGHSDRYTLEAYDQGLDTVPKISVFVSTHPVIVVAPDDQNYRTLTSRRYRATSGLSMGGFMSLYLSARFADLVGSASALNPGPEFYVGEKGRRSLWRPKDHVLNHEGTIIRLVRASGDYISQYHEETREAYASTPTINFESGKTSITGIGLLPLRRRSSSTCALSPTRRWMLRQPYGTTRAPTRHLGSTIMRCAAI